MRPALAIGVALVAPACAFLLDFDELQDDPGGTAGSAGAEGGVCSESCDDEDPCTIDRCEGTQCVNDPAYLVEDGLDHAEEVKFAYRVSLTAGTNRFYASSFLVSGASTDVHTYSFDGASGDVQSGPSFSDIDVGVAGGPVSALALAADKNTVPLQVNGYIAVGTDIGPADVARVFRVTFDENLGVTAKAPTGSAANYRADSAIRAPTAFKVEGGPVWGTWIGPGGEVYLHAGTAAAAEALPSSAGAHVATAAAGPNALGGAFYVSDAPKVQLPSMNFPAPLTECNTEPAAAYLGASSAYTGIGNLWLATWTKLTATSLVTQTAAFECSLGFCQAGSCVESSSVRNQVYALVRRALDPPNILYEFIARPSVDLQSGEGVLTLAMVRALLEPVDAGGKAEVVQALEIARYPLGSKGEGPDWPAIAVLGDDRVGVGWIEQHETENYKVRFRRYRACYPGQ